MIKDIIQKIDGIALEDPHRLAYDYLGNTKTYGELKLRSDQYATKINSLGLASKEPIMIWGGQTFDVIAAFLGCLKSGHAYIPIASYSNSDRLFMIQDVSKATTVIAVDPLPVAVEGVNVIVPSDIDKIDSVKINEADFVAGDDNFYILFTSGTTGKPKGVQISYNNVVSFLNWEFADFKLSDRPKFLAQVTYSFDVSVMSIYPALLSGGSIVVMPHEITSNLGQLFKILPNLKFNIWVSTPSFVEMCFLDPTFNQEHHPDITHFLLCGEEFGHRTAQMLHNKFSNSHIFNTYGPTETTVAITQVEITDEILKKYNRLPIGKVKEDTVITIDTTKGQKESQGEIVVTGPTVSKGYMNDPERTKKVFFHQDGQKYPSYRVGDLGFFEDGMLFYRGRIDFQIKFNGFRIELEEINFYLSKNPLVRYGVVAPKYNKDNKVQQLVAVVELAEGVKEKYSEKEITQQIRESLEKEVMPYMIPQRFVYKDKLPISQNGKVNIKQVIKEVNNA